MHLQGMVWKSLSRQGNWSLLYNVDTWELLDLSYGERTLEEMVFTSWHSPWSGPGGHWTQPRTLLSNVTLKSYSLDEKGRRGQETSSPPSKSREVCTEDSWRS